MISVDQARQFVLQNVPTSAYVSTVPLSQSLGKRLAADIHSDVDSPPYDKSLVDGYAVLSSDLAGGVTSFDVLEEVTAGLVPTHSVAAGQATRIMTGAPMPNGADCVVMIEQSTLDGSSVTLTYDPPLRPGANVMDQGRSLRAGDRVLSAGTIVRAIEIALLAEVGFQDVPVADAPTVAVLSTGDELVEPAVKPALGQIRNSNSYMLSAITESCGGAPTNLGIARDEREALSRLVAEGLTHQFLLLSGGVSAGVLDLVPGVLADAGVKQVFHKVHLKPGKPVWFGVGPDGQMVFGLPGNPVSSLVCFELFVKPALRALLGATPISAPGTAALSHQHQQRGGRPTYFPASLCASTNHVTLVNWQGSADMRSLADANCLAYFPPGEATFEAGDSVEIHSLS